MDIKTLGIKKIRFTNLLGIAFGKRTVLFLPGKQKHITFEMRGSKFNIHITKEPFHKGLRKEFFEVDLSLPKEKYATFEKRMIEVSLWLLNQALIFDPQSLATTGVKAISEMPDQNALVAAGIVKRRELIIDDMTFIDKMTFYHPETLWSFELDKICYGWKLSKRGDALILSGVFLVFGRGAQRVVYYFHKDMIGRLMWHNLMVLISLGLSYEQKTMERINTLANVVISFRKRFGKLSGIVDIVGEVSPAPRKVVKVYSIKSSLPLLKRKVPKEIMGIKVIMKSVSLNADGMRNCAKD